MNRNGLGEQLPGLWQALGPARFDAEAATYAAANHEDSAIGLARHIAEGAPEDWIASLAMLELAALICRQAQEGAGLDAEMLAAMRVDDASVLSVAPWALLLDTEWRVLDWYAAVLGGSAPPEPTPDDDLILVARCEGEVRFERLTAGAYALLEALADGQGLGAAAGAAAALDEGLDLTAELARMARLGLVTAVNGRTRPDPRDEPFSHVCGRCTLCCRHKTVRTDPHEIARLARQLGLTTGDMAARFTQGGGGTVLARQPDGACVFLKDNACSVWPARPLTCRLYPLGLVLRPDGTEAFVRAELPVGKLGKVSDEGTIGAFLDAQDAEAFIAASKRYDAWLARAEARLGIRARAVSRPRKSAAAAALIDLDTAVARHCRLTGHPEPTDLTARIDLHLQILEAALNAASTQDQTATLKAASGLLARGLGVTEA